MDNINHLLQVLLNLTSSDIQTIRITNKDSTPFYFVRLNSSLRECPICSSTSFRSLGYYKREVTLPNNVFTGAKIILEVPRKYCCTCNSSFSDMKHMAPKNKTISYKTILEVMELLKDQKMTFNSVATLLHISESSVVRIFDSHCHITRSIFPDVVCIDEVYTKNSDFNSKYSCIFYDFYQHSIIDVAPSRHKSYLHHYFQDIPRDELLNVKYVCIDMYHPYKDIVKIYFKKALICVDSFHVIKHLNEDLSKVRIRVMKKYSIDSNEYYLLKNWKNLLFDNNIELNNQGKYNKRFKQVLNYRQLQELIFQIDSDIKLAYQLKDNYMRFNQTSTIEEAPTYLDALIESFTLANIPEYAEFTGLLTNWRQEIINSFTLYKGRRINNSIAESMNAKISTLLFNTKGIRNHERRKKRIMYMINKTGFSVK